MPDPVPCARWPHRVQELARLQRDRDSLAPTLRGELWRLLHGAVRLYADLHQRRTTGLDLEDLRDIASEKALDLLARIDSGQWSPEADSPGEVKGFLSTVARNGVVDRLRELGRASDSTDRAAVGPDGPVAQVTPETGVDRDEFVEAIVGCSRKLPERWQAVWRFRVLYEWSSKDIARRPEIGMNAAHVDVTLGRCRERIRECMAARGLSSKSLPPGTFAALWERLELPETLAEGGSA